MIYNWQAKRNGRRPSPGKRKDFGPALIGSSHISVSPQDRILVLAVHPDDESLAVGGLIQHARARGANLRVVFVTDGDDNPWPQRFLERRWRIGAGDRARWGERRRGEAMAALSRLGVPRENAEFWGLPDQGITALFMEKRGELLRRLSEAIRVWNPSIVVGPSMDDLHPDHNSLAVLVEGVLADISPHVRPQMLLYLVHAASNRPKCETGRIDLSPGQVAAKRQAILEHQTQMALCRRRFSAFACPVETFQVGYDRANGSAQPQRVTAGLVEETLLIAADCVKRPSRLLISAEGTGGPVSLAVRIPLIGDAVVQDANAARAFGNAPVIDGRTLALPAAPFAGAKTVALKRTDGFGIFDRSGWQQADIRPRGLPEKTGAGRRPRVCCIIPCYNIAEVCGPVVDEAAHFADRVIAIDDGSSDETGSRLAQVAQRFPDRVHVLRFARNMGKGVVMIAAIRHALAKLEFDVLVTLDGDGQHRPEDIPRVAQELIRGDHALVIGERLDRAKMPLRSRFGNTLTGIVMRAFHPAAPTDTQSGFRAISPAFAREVVQKINGGRYETELKILLLALTREYRIGSVTIPTVYLAGNRLSHFRPLVDSLKIYRILLSWKPEGGPMDRAPAIPMDVGP